MVLWWIGERQVWWCCLTARRSRVLSPYGSWDRLLTWISRRNWMAGSDWRSHVDHVAEAIMDAFFFFCLFCVCSKSYLWGKKTSFTRESIYICSFQWKPEHQHNSSSGSSCIHHSSQALVLKRRKKVHKLIRIQIHWAVTKAHSQSYLGQTQSHSLESHQYSRRSSNSYEQLSYFI